MAGHSKWANIKHKRGKADAARGKFLVKLQKRSWWRLRGVAVTTLISNYAH